MICLYLSHYPYNDWLGFTFRLLILKHHVEMQVLLREYSTQNPYDWAFFGHTQKGIKDVAFKLVSYVTIFSYLAGRLTASR